MKSVLQDWVMELPLREQGVLCTGVRGCDLAPKPITGGDATPERELTGFLRYCFMTPADPREVGIKGAFFNREAPTNWKASMLGHYPLHWYSHLMHAFEVVAYRHPNSGLANQAMDVYEKLVHNLHLTVETSETMFERLSEDRIANGTVVS